MCQFVLNLISFLLRFFLADQDSGYFNKTDVTVLRVGLYEHKITTAHTILAIMLMNILKNIWSLKSSKSASAQNLDAFKKCIVVAGVSFL